MQKKSFQIFQIEFFSNSTSFLLKKSYIPSNIAPFNYPGTLRVIGPGSGPGPGNGKSQKNGSGSPLSLALCQMSYSKCLLQKPSTI